ncbi:MAG TPA: hypothetical protein VGE07_17910 [Herpetosiphonaceae bacterium]
MANIGGIIALIIGGTLSITALFAVLGALFQRPIEQASAVAGALPGRALLVGLINVAFFGALGAVLGGIAEAGGRWGFGVLGLLAWGLLAAAAILGLAAVAKFVGGRLAPASTPQAQAAVGAVALCLACLTPYVGWYGLLPYVALLGVGSLVISLFAATRLLADDTDDGARER